MDESELFFEELERDKENIKRVWQYIKDKMDRDLSRRNYASLFELIPYIETGDGQLAFHYVGESRRILTALHIMQLEVGQGIEPFGEGCADMRELMEKYMLTLFALRRILFHMSEQCIDEGIAFLKASTPSAFALHVILENDLILPDSAFRREVGEILRDFWTERERQFFAIAGEAG